MKKITPKAIIVPAAALLIICLVATALLALTNNVTASKIAANQVEKENSSRALVLPEAAEFSDVTTLENGITYCVGTKDSNDVGYVFTSGAKGYGGTVSVMIGMDTEGVITGIEILSHDETPGLGANSTKPDFKNRFIGKSGELTVNKTSNDGQNVQAITAATITSKAVVSAVNAASAAFETIKEVLPMAEKRSLGKEFTKGILAENPTLRLVLGTCPTLATTTSVQSALGMGVAASIVLVCSNIAISALRKVIPEKVRIPAYVVVIASFVTIVQMLVKAFAPDLDEQLGVYLPLIVVNCIILGRAEAFASKNPVLASAVDGLGMGVGFTTALFLMSSVREILGAGSFLGLSIPFLSQNPMLIFILPPGGFFVFGVLMATVNKIAESKGKPRAELRGCEACPMAATCTLNKKEEESGDFSGDGKEGID